MCCPLKFRVVSCKCCLLSLSVSHCRIFVLTMPRLCFIGDSSYSLSNHFLSFLFKSRCLFLSPPFPNLHTKLFPAHQDFRTALDFGSFLFITTCHLVTLSWMATLFPVLFSCLVMLLSTMFPNLPMPNPSMFYNHRNF